MARAQTGWKTSARVTTETGLKQALCAIFFLIFSFQLWAQSAPVVVWYQPDVKKLKNSNIRKITFPGQTLKGTRIRWDYKKSIVVQAVGGRSKVELPASLGEYLTAAAPSVASRLKRRDGSSVIETPVEPSGNFELQLALPIGLTQVAIELIRGSMTKPFVVLFEVTESAVKVNAELSERGTFPPQEPPPVAAVPELPPSAVEPEQESEPLPKADSREERRSRDLARMWQLALSGSIHSTSFDQSFSDAENIVFSNASPELQVDLRFLSSSFGGEVGYNGGSESLKSAQDPLIVADKSYAWDTLRFALLYHATGGGSDNSTIHTIVRLGMWENQYPMLEVRNNILSIKTLKISNLIAGISLILPMSEDFNFLMDANYLMPSSKASTATGTSSFDVNSALGLAIGLEQKRSQATSILYRLGYSSQNSSYTLTRTDNSVVTGSIQTKEFHLSVGGLFHF